MHNTRRVCVSLEDQTVPRRVLLFVSNVVGHHRRSRGGAGQGEFHQPMIDHRPPFDDQIFHHTRLIFVGDSHGGGTERRKFCLSALRRTHSPNLNPHHQEPLDQASIHAPDWLEAPLCRPAKLSPSVLLSFLPWLQQRPSRRDVVEVILLAISET